jgi:CHAT domain-containing protein
VLIGDPNRDDHAPLPGALEETNAVADVYRSRAEIEPTVLVGPDASFDRLVTEFSSTQYDVVHFAGHGGFDELEPYVFLSGEAKLRSSELRSLLTARPPAILFLNSHFTIFTPPGASTDGASTIAPDAKKPNAQGQRGFIDAASTAGVGALIGCFAGALDDATAKDVGVSFHEALVNGAPVAQALHQAVVAGNPDRAEASVSRLSYAISGYADIALPVAVAPATQRRRPKRRRSK